MALPALALLAAVGVGAGEIPVSIRPVYDDISAPVGRKIERIEDILRLTLTGRRLLAETGGVRRRTSIAGLPGSEAVSYLRVPQPMIVFDSARLPTVDLGEFELAYARELAKAALDIPLDLPETDMAVCQTELAYALDRAENDPEFSRILTAKFEAAEAKLDKLPSTPVDELARAGYYLALVDRAPDQFYWVVERDRTATPASVRLTELEDFYARFGPRFENAQDSPRTPWVRMGGLRYPAVLLRAARSIAESGGPARIREALGDFEGGPAQELRRRTRRWLHRPP